MEALGKWGRFARSDGLGLLVTGNRTWRDAAISCTLNIHSAERAGVILNYQGLRRFSAVFLSHGRLLVIRNLYGETVLFDAPADVAEDRDVRLEVSTANGVIDVALDGAPAASVRDDALDCGGAGLCIDSGCFALVGDLRLSAEVRG